MESNSGPFEKWGLVPSTNAEAYLLGVEVYVSSRLFGGLYRRALPEIVVFLLLVCF